MKNDVFSCAKNGDCQTFAQILTPAQLLTQNKAGATPLHLAVMFEKFEIIETVLKCPQGIQSLLVRDYYQRTPLRAYESVKSDFKFQEFMSHQYSGKTLLQICFDAKNKEAIQEVMSYRMGCVQLSGVSNTQFDEVFNLSFSAAETMRNQVLSAVRNHVAFYGPQRCSVSMIGEVVGRLLTPISSFNKAFDEALTSFRKSYEEKSIIAYVGV
ncbi:MAG: hypothetical protein ACHP6I_02090 [Rickettsiales bacterium]